MTIFVCDFYIIHYIVLVVVVIAPVQLKRRNLLQKLHHDNLVNMIEVFRRRKRLYLVFEYLDHTVLDELEETKSGLDWDRSRRYIFQILRGLDFCHNHKVSVYRVYKRALAL